MKSNDLRRCVVKVDLTYFKQSGKYYADGSYETEKVNILDIWKEVREMIANKKLPGLMEGHSEFIVSVDIPEHPVNHPHLFNVKGE